jgi:hypothetical protein
MEMPIDRPISVKITGNLPLSPYRILSDQISHQILLTMLYPICMRFPISMGMEKRKNAWGYSQRHVGAECITHFFSLMLWTKYYIWADKCKKSLLIY